MENLGHKIKTLRKKLKITQSELSCDILHRSSISKIENGRLTPSLSQLEYIAFKLNVDLSHLLNDNNLKLRYENITYNTKYLSSLFDDKKYLDIIEKVKPCNFITHYYVGMSYYRIDLEKNAELHLSNCEKLFNTLSDDDKITNVERLCFALNCLRKIKILDLSDILNKEYLKKALKYLSLYTEYKSEIYFILNNNMTAYYITNKKYNETISFIEKFLEENNRINSFTTLPYVYLNLNIAYFAIKNYSKAIESINKSIFFYNYIGDNFQEGECYINLFNCYLYSNEYDKCYDLLKILPIKFKDDNLNQIYKVLELVLFYNTNDLKEIIEKSKYINLKKLRNKTKMDYYFVLGRTNFLLGNYTTASNHYKKCINYLSKTEKYLDLSLIYNDLFIIYNENDYHTKYLEYKNKYVSSEFNSIYPNITSPNYFL